MEFVILCLLFLLVGYALLFTHSHADLDHGLMFGGCVVVMFTLALIMFGDGIK